MHKCLYCKKEIVLIPSAQERAKKCGNTPAFYTNLFQYHTECALKMRIDETRNLMRAINKGN